MTLTYKGTVRRRWIKQLSGPGDCSMSTSGCPPCAEHRYSGDRSALRVPGIKPYSAHFLNGVEASDFPILKRRTGKQAKKCYLYDPSHREYLLYQE